MRYVVIGTSGAGKSTLSQALAQALSQVRAPAAQCPHIELDNLYWGPGWQPVSTAVFTAALRTATDSPCWVADGNYSAIRGLLWGRATHVVWLNYGRRTVWPRVLWRTVGRVLRRTPLEHGNRESLYQAFFSADSILLWSIRTFAKNQTKYQQLRQAPEYQHLQWLEFHHPAQAAVWLEQLRAGASP